MTPRLWFSLVTRIVLLPPLSLFILFAAGWLLSLRRPRAGRTLMIASAALLFLLCTEFGSGLLLAPLEARTAPLASPRDAHAQAIVVLAAGSLEQAPEYGGADIPDYIALARLRYAARIEHETGLPILVSGGNVRIVAPAYAAAGGAPGHATYSKADAMAAALRNDFRTPVQWVEGRSDTTAENARFSAAMLRQDGVRRILLVTDAMHMPRAKMIFARNGLDVVAAPTVFFSTRSIEWLSFVPSAEGLRRSHYALYEWLGYVWYAIAESNAAPASASTATEPPAPSS